MSNTFDPEQYALETRERLRTVSDAELIGKIERERHIRAYVSARGIYLAALRDELRARNITTNAFEETGAIFLDEVSN